MYFAQSFDCLFCRFLCTRIDFAFACSFSIFNLFIVLIFRNWTEDRKKLQPVLNTKTYKKVKYVQIRRKEDRKNQKNKRSLSNVLFVCTFSLATNVLFNIIIILNKARYKVYLILFLGGRRHAKSSFLSGNRILI